MRPCPPLPLALALACLLQLAATAGVFELQILELSNYRLELASGACCGGAGAPAPGTPCSRPCRTRFSLCLKEYQSVAAPGACSFGRKDSPPLGTDSFTLAEPLHTLALPFSFRWTRSFTLVLQAFDDYEYPEAGEALIEEAWWSGIVEPGAEWHALRWAGARAALAYRVRVLCQPNYYNTTCTTFCRARDDKFGHYSCEPSGSKRCLPGWQGDNCEKPVCKEGCHPTHGRCDQPGDCDCRPGWRGELCAQCQPYPGCKHGYCNGSSWDCTCDTNWGGILCDQDLNYCGTHEPCQHGGTCENTAPDQYLCRCAEGFSGADCQRVDNPCAPQPCRHGRCELQVQPAGAGFSCQCERGWGGALCDTDLDDCASAPCRHGGVCRDRLDAFVCECVPGWTGHTCEEDVDECTAVGLGGTIAHDAGNTTANGPCVNAAACNNTVGGYACACLAGWTGRDCDSNVDDCADQCLNGATCIDLVDDYHCACAAGYAGRTCALDVDDCAPRPCLNGGECVDLPDAYRCICPVGFSGTDCELSSCHGRYCSDDRDHCAGAPCGNGAACYTAQSDYYCHCSPGWSGKNCTVRAARELPSAPPSACVEDAACVHGRCLRAPEPRCLCESGYIGTLCDTQSDECAGAPCQNNGTCIDGTVDFACVCRDGWTGKTCSVRVEAIDRCPSGACENGGTCVREADGWVCACAAGWGGVTCDRRLASPPATGPCPCASGGDCVPSSLAPGGWECLCREGRTGARCDLLQDPCASAPCHNGGRCVAGGVGGQEWWTCECAPGWTGDRCGERARAPTPPPRCEPACPAPAACRADPDRAGAPPRCLCPSAPQAIARHCLESVAGLSVEGAEGTEGEVEGAGAVGGACGADGGAWWWGCNVCRCVRGTAVCTRLWCGVPDCLAAGATPCRTDEVCVPAAPALCVRRPCAPLGECRHVAGRSVEPPRLPAPPACWPGAPATGPPPPPGCVRLRLQLARARLAPGAHVERACSALRRALAAALAGRAPEAPPLALLCDIAPDDEDAIDLALWAGGSPDETGEAGEAGEMDEEGDVLAGGVRALGDLVARRRLASHPLLGAALRLRAPAPAPHAAPAAAAPAPALLAACCAVASLAALAAVAVPLVLRRRRRRAAVERDSRCDEEKSNNLQNEENLRRYANPLREDGDGGVGGGGSGELRAHSLYKAQNADARNDTPPAPRDKELTMRALPPPEPPPPRHQHAPLERLTVLV